MYGWQDFDQRVVAELASGFRPGVNDNDGMLCPLAGHSGEWLPWASKRSDGTDLHGDPRARFRASPTFVLADPLENLIVGSELVSGLVSGGKAESRMANENSEDAVTWNVFRSLQEAERLAAATDLLVGVTPSCEPDLFVWSMHVEREHTAEWPGLRAIRTLLEPGAGQQTEPDVCLHVRGWGWVFVEAKVASPMTVCRDDAHLARWQSRYLPHGVGILDAARIAATPPAELPEQLLRNVLFAHHIRADGEQAAVVSVTRARDKDPSAAVRSCLVDPGAVAIGHCTWERISNVLCAREEVLSGLCAYFERKSLSLRPAFDVGRPV